MVDLTGQEVGLLDSYMILAVEGLKSDLIRSDANILSASWKLFVLFKYSNHVFWNYLNADCRSMKPVHPLKDYINCQIKEKHENQSWHNTVVPH